MDDYATKAGERALPYLNPRHALAITQHEYAKTHANSRWFILGTRSIGPCLGVAIYNRTEGTATLAHIDGVTPDDEIDRLSSLSRSNKSIPLEFHLAGGNGPAPYQINRLVDRIKSIPNATIVSSNILGDIDKVQDLAIDARTGKVTTTHIEGQQLYYPDRVAREERLDRRVAHPVLEPLYEVDPKKYGARPGQAPRH